MEPGKERNAGARGRKPDEPVHQGCTAAAERFGGNTGCAQTAAMLPSLQESLDGDEKELESSEEGGSAEERRLEPPPSSHYCLYGYRGSRYRVRPPLRPCPGPAAWPRVPNLIRAPPPPSATPHSPFEFASISDICIAFVECRLTQQRADSDDGSPSGTSAETPSGDDFR
ncbi:Protein Njmu-R1 [Galemys pyrenaicus]|uniref:Protein Njmu-R1 n=1 Tax=Galemys pyrenaicus TaxID=202257 RepID=A0A8J6AYM4_GALPY|nr:Protein Njmu-R1 [Galemys pyrenaicus]